MIAGSPAVPSWHVGVDRLLGIKTYTHARLTVDLLLLSVTSVSSLVSFLERYFELAQNPFVDAAICQ